MSGFGERINEEGGWCKGVGEVFMRVGELVSDWRGGGNKITGFRGCNGERLGTGEQ